MGLGRTRRYNARSGRGVLNSSGHGVRPASSAATFLPARRQRLGRAGVSRRALLTELNHGNSITSVVRLPSPGSRLRGEHRAPHDLSLATPLPRRGSRLRRQLGQFSRAGAGQFSRAPKILCEVSPKAGIFAANAASSRRLSASTTRQNARAHHQRCPSHGRRLVAPRSAEFSDPNSMDQHPGPDPFRGSSSLADTALGGRSVPSRESVSVSSDRPCRLEGQ